jgi:phosphoribosylformylglycinamidine synthase I
VLKADGVNCEQETAHAFEQAGATPEIVHVNALAAGEADLDRFEALALPGGFSYGDDVASGQILAVELMNEAEVSKQLVEFVHDRKKPVIGICNGFQVLVRTGLVPRGEFTKVGATLVENVSGHFESRWVELVTNPDHRCVFLDDVPQALELPVAHREGRFVTDREGYRELFEGDQVVFSYAANGSPTEDFPANPNGSEYAVAGVTDRTGLVLGLMPHPERFTYPVQYVNSGRSPVTTAHGLQIFESMVGHLKAR